MGLIARLWNIENRFMYLFLIPYNHEFMLISSMEQQSYEPSAKYQRPEKKKNGVLKFFGIFFFIMFVLLICGFLPVIFIAAGSSGDSANIEYGDNDLVYTTVTGDSNSDNKLVILYIDAPILTSAQNYENDVLSTLLYGQYVFGYNVKNQLISLAEDSSVKGIFLHINTPGGTVAGARAISDGVSYYREKTGNPVYAYVQDMAASGGYWAAVSADRIIAEQGSLVGSIGVLMGPFEYYDELVQLDGVGARNGIQINYITGGKSKDLGNPTRQMTKEELEILQEGVDSEYDEFVSYVSSQRQIEESAIREDLGALVYGTKEALANNLIDEAGNWHYSIESLASEAGVSSDYKVVRIGSQTTFLGALWSKFESKPQTAEIQQNKCLLCNKMLYFYGDPYSY